MTKSDPSVGRRLFRLLNRIIGEERNFKRNSPSRQGRPQRHSRARSPASVEIGTAGELEHVRLAHDAMFKIHRKFISDHELIVQRCLAISRQARAGLLNKDEMAMEIERLQRELRRMRQQHTQVEREYRHLLKTQQQYFNNPGDSH